MDTEKLGQTGNGDYKAEKQPVKSPNRKWQIFKQNAKSVGGIGLKTLVVIALIIVSVYSFGVLFFSFTAFMLDFSPDFWKNTGISGTSFLKIVTTLYTSLIAVSGVAGTIAMGLYNSKKSKAAALHAESNWRAELFAIIDNPEWKMKELLGIKNRLNPESSNPNFAEKDELECRLSITVDKMIDQLSHTDMNDFIKYDDTLRLRQLVRMWLKNDWVNMGDSPTPYRTTMDIDRGLSSAGITSDQK